MKISPIKFKNFETKTIDEFEAFVDRYIGYNLLILIGTKYDDFCHAWQSDWNEGQEYLGGAVLDYYEKVKKEVNDE